jgi:glycosyltransferase involved in cell wall biosynthesis
MIGIFSNTNTSLVRGPQKVFLNLIKGLDLLKIDYNINHAGEFNGCLNSHRRFWSILPENTLMGPNLVVNPPDDVELFNRFKNILVPSNMVMYNYKKFDVTKSTKFFVHATGIDTDFWDVKKSIDKDCLIYFKNRNEQELEDLKKMLDEKNITYYVLKYGSYHEEQLKEILTKVKFTILLTNTESQGIGYMEILSTNTPCFVFNKIYDDGVLRGESVQYFNSECGIIYNGSVSSDMFVTFNEFLDSISNFEPRNFIIKNFTLLKSAEKYVNFLLNE